MKKAIKTSEIIKVEFETRYKHNRQPYFVIIISTREKYEKDFYKEEEAQSFYESIKLLMGETLDL